MALKASRYLPQCRDPKEYGKLIESVQKLDYQIACTLYDELVPQLTDPEVALLAANDRYFLLSNILGRKDVRVDPLTKKARSAWLYNACREVENKPYGHVDLWAREHYKTTIISFAGTIQEILCDPEITIGLFSATMKLARNIVRQIMDEFEQNKRLQQLFPDVLYDKTPKTQTLWSNENGIIVKRKGNPREPTLSGWGLLDGMPTGFHFRLRVYDDVITEKNVTNPEQIQKITERWELSDNLGAGEGLLAVVGTRYYQGDTYEQMIDRNVVVPRLKPATDTGRADGVPVFLSKEAWEKKKKTQRSSLAAQMLQNPLADGQAIFDPLTLRPYGLRPRTLRVYILGDYAGSKSKYSDKTAFAVIGIDSAGNKYLLDGYCHRMSLTEKWTCLSSLWKKWSGAPGVQGIEVGYERYGAQSDIQYFEREMMEPGSPKFPIQEVNYANELKDQSKRSRVARLEPDFTSNSFYLPAKVWRPNAAWWVTGPKGWVNPETKKSYGPNVEIGGPMPDDVDGVSHSGPRVCLWSVDQNDGRIIYRPIPMKDINYTETKEGEDGKEYTVNVRKRFSEMSGAGGTPQATTLDKQAISAKEPFRIVKPIYCTDSDEPPNSYDLTHEFIAQFKAFPKSTDKDLLDAVSRIYDLNPVPAMIIEEQYLKTPVYDD